MNLGRGLTEIDLLFYMMTPKLRGLASKHSGLLLDKFNKSDLIKSIILYYQSQKEITHSDCKILLGNIGLIGEHYDRALSAYEDGLKLDDAGLNVIKGKFRSLVSHELLKKAQTYPNPIEAVKVIQDCDISTETDIDSHNFIDYNFSDIDISKIREEFGSPIPSFSESVNKSFIIGGYIQHQLINVVAPPSVGKSLFLMNETNCQLAAGYKVLYVALGDLMAADFVSRITAINTKRSIDDCIMNLDKYWVEMKNSLGSKINNLKLLYINPGTTTIKQLYDYLHYKGYIPEYDTIILDYDSNFASENEMYQKGDEVYTLASQMSREVKLVFIASQPKIFYYGSELIPLEGAAESARKSQIVDVMITIGRCPDVISAIGYIHLAKIRRGGRRTHFMYNLSPNGVFSEINAATFNQLKRSQELCGVNVRYDAKALEQEFATQMAK